MQDTINNNIKLLIIEDHNIVAIGLKALLSAHSGLNLIDTTTTAKEAIAHRLH